MNKSGQEAGSSTAASAPDKSIYEFKVPSLDGDTIDFSSFKGKWILVVNTASKCGYTNQYEALESVYKTYQQKLAIVGFPSDNFMGQEFEQNSDIKEFCQKNYGVSFPMTTRVDVKGDNATPIFKYLCSKAENGVLDAKISWNFNKFLINPQGIVVAHFESKTKPDSQDILSHFQ
jgi:glutathione peroxidase